MGTNLNQSISITALAKERGKSRWTMWRKLRTLDRMFPELGLLRGTPGQHRAIGMYYVNARALAECTSLIAAENTHEQILQRIDLHEGIFRGLKIRLKKLEKRMSAIDGGPKK